MIAALIIGILVAVATRSVVSGAISALLFFLILMVEDKARSKW